jgi:hypothetical protein
MGDKRPKAPAGRRVPGIPALNLSRLTQSSGGVSHKKPQESRFASNANSTPRGAVLSPRNMTSPPGTGATKPASSAGYEAKPQRPGVPGMLLAKQAAADGAPRLSSGAGSGGSLGGHTADSGTPLMTPRGSYRDALATPRSAGGGPLSYPHHAAPRPAAGGAAPPPGGAAHSPPTTARGTRRPSFERHAEQVPAAPAARQQPTQQQQQQQQDPPLRSQMERALHESGHVAAQMATLQGSISASQGDLQARISAVAALGAQRNALAARAAALQAAVARAQGVAARRRGEAEQAELLVQALDVSLHEARACEGAATTDAAAARAALLRMVQAAAEALQLPEAAAAAGAALGGGAAGTGRAAAAAAAAAAAVAGATARSDATTQFDTPATTVRDLDSGRSMRSISESDATPSPRRRVDPQAAARMQRGVKMPPLRLPMTAPPPPPPTSMLPAAAAAALGRLASIRAKLNAAESVLSARMPSGGSPVASAE